MRRNDIFILLLYFVLLVSIGSGLKHVLFETSLINVLAGHLADTQMSEIMGRELIA